MVTGKFDVKIQRGIGTGAKTGASTHAEEVLCRQIRHAGGLKLQTLAG